MPPNAAGRVVRITDFNLIIIECDQRVLSRRHSELTVLPEDHSDFSQKIDRGDTHTERPVRRTLQQTRQDGGLT